MNQAIPSYLEAKVMWPRIFNHELQEAVCWCYGERASVIQYQSPCIHSLSSHCMPTISQALRAQHWR